MSSSSTVATAAGPTSALEEMELFVERNGSRSATPWYSVSTPDRIAMLAAERSRRLLTDSRTQTLLSHHHAELVGLVCWTWLDWDTEQFGFPAARLDLLTASGDRDVAGRDPNVAHDQGRDPRCRGRTQPTDSSMSCATRLLARTSRNSITGSGTPFTCAADEVAAATKAGSRAESL